MLRVCILLISFVIILVVVLVLVVLLWLGVLLSWVLLVLVFGVVLLIWRLFWLVVELLAFVVGLLGFSIVILLMLISIVLLVSLIVLISVNLLLLVLPEHLSRVVPLHCVASLVLGLGELQLLLYQVVSKLKVRMHGLLLRHHIQILALVLVRRPVVKLLELILECIELAGVRSHYQHWEGYLAG